MSLCLHSYMPAFLKNEFCLSRNSVLIAPSWAKRKLGLGIRPYTQSKESVSSSADLDSTVLTFVRVSGEKDEILHCLSLSKNGKPWMAIRDGREVRYTVPGHLSAHFSCHHNISLDIVPPDSTFLGLSSDSLLTSKQRKWEKLLNFHGYAQPFFSSVIVFENKIMNSNIPVDFLPCCVQNTHILCLLLCYIKESWFIFPLNFLVCGSSCVSSSFVKLCFISKIEFSTL